MRLTEEIVRLLTNLQNQVPLQKDEFEEAISECEHEGWLSRTEADELTLTAQGSAKLREIEQRIFPANQLRLNEESKIAFISQRHYDRFQKLQSLGLSAGVPLKLRQRFPSFVIQCEETEIALEEEIARDIFVWRQ